MKSMSKNVFLVFPPPSGLLCTDGVECRGGGLCCRLLAGVSGARRSAGPSRRTAPSGADPGSLG